MSGLSSIVSSSIFGIRNCDKGNNGHVVRYGVALGQARNVMNTIKEFDNTIGKTAQTANVLFNHAAKNSILVECLGKATTFAGEHINPLIVASGIYDVFVSDNKLDTAVVTGTALGTMFTGEKLMKMHMNDIPKLSCSKGIAEKIGTIAATTKYGKFIGPFISGVSFVLGSCMSYFVGEKIGKALIGKNNSCQTEQNVYA